MGVVTWYCASMAGIDQFRSASDADPTFQTYVDRVASLCSAPVQQRLLRILVNFVPGAFRR
jgi:hypothetical protein